MNFFSSNGADKPEQKKTKQSYSTKVGLFVVFTLLMAAIALILSILHLIFSHVLPR